MSPDVWATIGRWLLVALCVACAVFARRQSRQAEHHAAVAAAALERSQDARRAAAAAERRAETARAITETLAQEIRGTRSAPHRDWEVT